MHANPQQMHAQFRRGILQPPVTQHAKTTFCVPQVTAKEANMHKINSKNHTLLRNAKVKAQPTTTKLN
jgi:hypothetical protein